MQNKALGAEIALRTLFPDVIAFDEIGTNKEVISVRDCFNAGVSIITTAHGRNKSDIIGRTVIKSIIQSGAISNVALLSQTIGAPPQIFSIKEFCVNADC